MGHYHIHCFMIIFQNKHLQSIGIHFEGLLLDLFIIYWYSVLFSYQNKYIPYVKTESQILAIINSMEKQFQICKLFMFLFVMSFQEVKNEIYSYKILCFILYQEFQHAEMQNGINFLVSNLTCKMKPCHLLLLLS